MHNLGFRLYLLKNLSRFGHKISHGPQVVRNNVPEFPHRTMCQRVAHNDTAMDTTIDEAIVTGVLRLCLLVVCSTMKLTGNIHEMIQILW